MQVCLVSDHGESADATLNLGHLCLTPIIEACGGTVDLVEACALPAALRTSTAAIAERVLERGPDLIGLTGMCNTYHRVLDVAVRCKQARPGVHVVLGGPQASATDVATMEAFPAVDMVVCGEGEETLRELLEALDAGRDPAGIPGLTCRRGGRIVKGPAREVVANLDALPIPAFDRQPYEAGVANVEAGRGCPFACIYCSTSGHWHRLYRVKSPRRIVQEMALLRARHGVTTFSLVHDLFTVNRRAVEEFCEELRRSALDVSWGCSARTDLLDESLLERMAGSGCVSIYFGVEAGSEASQRAIGKRLDLDEARRVIGLTARRGVRVTASFIAGFPDDTRADVRATFDFAAGLLPESLVRLELHRLMLLSGTPLVATHADNIEFPGEGVEQQGVEQVDDAWRHVRRHPRLFPSFARLRTTVHGLQETLAHVEVFGHVGLNLLRLSAAVAIAESGGDSLDFYRRWLRAMIEERLLSERERGGEPQTPPVQELIGATGRFLVEREAAGRAPAFRDLVRYEITRSRVEWKQAARGTLSSSGLSRDGLLALVPRVNPTAVVAQFSYDMADLLSRARSSLTVQHCPERPCDVLFWMPDITRTLSRSLSGGARRLLDACQDALTGRDLIARLSADGGGHVSGEAWANLLELFYRTRVLVAGDAGAGGLAEAPAGRPRCRR